MRTLRLQFYLERPATSQIESMRQEFVAKSGDGSAPNRFDVGT